MELILNLTNKVISFLVLLTLQNKNKERNEQFIQNYTCMVVSVSELSTLDWRKIIEGAFDATETFLYCILNITTMAKSLRSKWKRKMKAEKRVRYGQKERDRLEKMLASYDKEEKERQEQKEKELMEHEPQVLGEA